MGEQGSLSITELILNATIAVKFVMIVLVCFSLISWTIIVQKTSKFKLSKKKADQFEEHFWSGVDLNHLYNECVSKQNAIEGLEVIYASGFKEFVRLINSGPAEQEVVMDGTYRQMKVACSREIENLENKLATLASIGSLSPYVGLFGTVIGIMYAFVSLASVKNATLAMVAPPIAEALIATAMGLFAAIPAVLFYNRFIASVEALENRYLNFMDEFATILNRRLVAIKSPNQRTQQQRSSASQVNNQAPQAQHQGQSATKPYTTAETNNVNHASSYNRTVYEERKSEAQVNNSVEKKPFYQSRTHFESNEKKDSSPSYQEKANTTVQAESKHSLFNVAKNTYSNIKANLENHKVSYVATNKDTSSRATVSSLGQQATQANVTNIASNMTPSRSSGQPQERVVSQESFVQRQPQALRSINTIQTNVRPTQRVETRDFDFDDDEVKPSYSIETVSNSQMHNVEKKQDEQKVSVEKKDISEENANSYEQKQPFYHTRYTNINNQNYTSQSRDDGPHYITPGVNGDRQRGR